MLGNDERMQLQEEVTTETSIDWRETFMKAYRGTKVLLSGTSHTHKHRLLCFRCFCPSNLPIQYSIIILVTQIV